MGRLLGCMMLALLLPPLVSGWARGQDATRTLPTFPEVPDFTQFVNTPEDVIQVQAKEPVLSIPTSPNVGVPVFDKAPPSKSPGYEPLVQQALKSSDYADERYLLKPRLLMDVTLTEKMKLAYQDQVMRLFYDFRSFYGRDNLRYVGLAILVAAPLANTSADRAIRNAYQDGIGSHTTLNHFATAGGNVGDYKYAVPALFAISLAGHLFPENEYATPFAQFGDRSLRAIIVGAPTVGILQVGLGGDGPPDRSHWSPGRASRSASAHAFVGAIPFLTAAEMVENRALKTFFVVGSTWPAWSRIHDDRHYFSQVLLGWSIACLATQTVAGTDMDQNAMQIVPLPTADGMGLGVQIRY